MKTQIEKDKIVVELEDRTFEYDKQDWSNKENFMYNGEVLYLKEWKIDLIKNHGADLDEL